MFDLRGVGRRASHTLMATVSYIREPFVDYQAPDPAQDDAAAWPPAWEKRSSDCHRGPFPQ